MTTLRSSLRAGRVKVFPAKTKAAAKPLSRATKASREAAKLKGLRRNLQDRPTAPDTSAHGELF